MRLIDADEIVKDLKIQMDISNPNWSWDNHAVCQDLLEYLEKFPTIETTKSGKWVSDIAGVVRCSACKHQAYFLRGYEFFDYCPYCGAKMDKEVWL